MSATVWDSEPSTPLARLDGDVRADICVIGLGGAGLSAIAELAARGLSVVGIDAGELGGGAAGRNGGFLLGGLADFFHVGVARFGGELAAQMYQHTLDEIRRMAAEFPEHVRVTGSLRLAASSDEIRDCEEHRRALVAHGFAAERYSGAEGTGLLVPTDAVYHPQRCLRAAAAKLPGNRVRLFARTRALALGPGRVTTAAGEITCDRMVVAIDGGLEVLLPELQPRVRTARLQMLATAPTREVSFPRPVYWRHGYEYWQQLPTGQIALGGFRDRGGEAEWTTSGAAGGIVQELLEQFLRTRLKVTAPITHRWAAGVAYTAERLPILEEVRERVWATGGYSGTGNIPSRRCGRAVAQLACGVKSDWAELLALARRHLRSSARAQTVAGPAASPEV